MTAKVFFQKLKSFIKRNLPAMAVSFCMIFALSLVTAVAVTRMQEPSVPVTSTPEIPDNPKPVTGPDAIVFAMPVEGAKEGLPFAQDNLVKFPTLNKWQTHEAVDFVALAGTRVVCAYDGEVESVEIDTKEGTVVVVNHGNGLKTAYKSLSSELTVKQGQKLKKGDQIGTVSNSSRSEESLGAHLHFEVILNGENVDPFDYLPSSDK